MGKIKRMTVKEFRKLGYLQELNRCFLHPLGLALEVIIDEENKKESFGEIWDYREDPEGIIFDDFDFDKSKRIEMEMKEKLEYRKRNLGYEIQSIPENLGIPTKL